VLHFTHKIFFEDSVLLAPPSDTTPTLTRDRDRQNDIFPRAVQEAQGASAAIFVQFQLCYFTFAGCGRSYAQNVHVALASSPIPAAPSSSKPPFRAPEPITPCDETVWLFRAPSPRGGFNFFDQSRPLRAFKKYQKSTLAVSPLDLRSRTNFFPIKTLANVAPRHDDLAMQELLPREVLFQAVNSVDQ
jgi:hypothetical protein